MVGATGILITLSAGNGWRELGDEIRAALDQALSDPAGWHTEPSSDGGVPLAQIVQELLEGPIGRLIESHGGSIELVSVVGDDVTVRMSGACHGCPAADSTLYQNLQRELRQRAGEQVTVLAEGSSGPTMFGTKLRRLLIERRR